MNPADAGEATYYELADGYELMRLEVDDDHYYYGGPKDQEKQFYLSVTKVLDIAGPFPEGLRQYLRVTSYEEQKERLEYTGNRGSALHAVLEQLMNAEEVDLREYKTRFEKDAIVTFIRMMRFLDPKNYKTELVVADQALRIAGTLDFEGWVDSWKLTALLDPTKYMELDSDGDFMLKEAWLKLAEDYPGRIRAVIDWKFTGRSQYSHEVQVAAYKTMYNKTRKGNCSRAFTWRYSPRHKFGFDFRESHLTYESFKRIYRTAIEYLSGFPEPPVLKKYPEKVRLYQPKHERVTTTNGSPRSTRADAVHEAAGS